ncbi:BPTI/Kunitz domain-containing protein 4-like [Mytilus trossulus]|uniref:BPTI/Kunitz domain-containing protein 4-like n=1 Tax=Mytilus trossulus TaxID=6551 RepID=UPI0030069883
MLKVSFIYIIHLILLSQVFATEASHVLLGKDAAVKCEKWKVDCPRQTTCVIYMMIWQSNIELEIPICLKKKKVEKMLQKEISKTCHEENDRNKKCTSRWVRWYFNMFDKKCKFFLYGGCQSRNNNFKSKVECENTCIYKNPDLSFRVKYQNIFCPKCIKCRN